MQIPSHQSRPAVVAGTGFGPACNADVSMLATQMHSTNYLSAFLFEDELVAKREGDALRFGPDADEARQLPTSILLLFHGNVDQCILAEHAPESNDRCQRSNRSCLHDTSVKDPTAAQLPRIYGTAKKL